MLIRKEEAKDYEIVCSVVKSAFDSAEHTDGNEHNLVKALREGKAYIPELSLVAEINGKIAGHIMFTQAEVINNAVLALAPLSVLPEYQRKGIGAALIKEGHKIAKRLGYGYSVVLGSEKYYSKFGYLPAAIYGIKPPFDVPGKNFMAYKINETAPDIHGIIRYAKEFGID
ncbi:N-acetyltransferase [Ruminococcus sp. Marseille-P6503]|uniref:GNAT family N-acetyltransferase n=1 Tax=Ruminococcus sp. Marseille-P6503 TaxID=2364796 RepID=UPI000F54A8B2|nr:N-acetyltransferase [Ruminococcus sp. Marseille-P6503]